MTKKESIIEEAKRLLQDKDFNCCECIIKAVKDGYDLPYDDNILKMASGMEGGIGGQGCICSALSGCVMALGLIYGRSKAKEDYSKIKSLSAELYTYYEDNFSFFCCRTQLKDFADKNGSEAQAHCLNLIETMLDKTCDIIEREGLK